MSPEVHDVTGKRALRRADILLCFRPLRATTSLLTRSSTVYCSTTQIKSVLRDRCAIVCDSGPDSRDVRCRSDSRLRLLTGSRRHFAFSRFKESATRVAKRADTNARRLSFDSCTSSTPSSVIGFKPRTLSRRPVTSRRASHADSRRAFVFAM